MKTALICWLGMTDIRCSLGTEPGLGPIGQAAKERSYDSVELISNSSKQEGATYVAWLRERTKSQINLHQVKLSSPMNYGEIYERADDIVSGLLQKEPRSLVFHLSPGTSAMAAMWLVLATTKYPAELIASSKEEGVYSPLGVARLNRQSIAGGAGTRCWFRSLTEAAEFARLPNHWRSRGTSENAARTNRTLAEQVARFISKKSAAELSRLKAGRSICLS